MFAIGPHGTPLPVVAQDYQLKELPTHPLSTSFWNGLLHTMCQFFTARRSKRLHVADHDFHSEELLYHPSKH